MNYTIIDASGLMHQARHSTGDLSMDTRGTGIIYGFLNQILAIKRAFPKNQILLCYDSRKSLRKQLFPDYKKKRIDSRTPEEEQELIWAYEQFDTIRKEVMHQLGFWNAYIQTGYEADDLIAQLCLQVSGPNDQVVIVSRDQDLYQLIKPWIAMYNTSKKELYGHDEFFNEWGMDPSRWWEVKALAGCKTDSVPGIDGIGEKTAVRYLLDELSPGKKLGAIIANGSEVMQRNKPLVKLPFSGVKRMEIRKNLVFNKRRFLDMCSQYAFESLVARIDLWEEVFKHGI